MIVICGPNQYELRDLTPDQWRTLKHTSYDNAQRHLLLTVEQWEEYCYIWRTSAPRFSTEGLISARGYCLRHGIDPAPLGTFGDFI